jgi:hypothetical protein
MINPECRKISIVIKSFCAKRYFGSFQRLLKPNLKNAGFKGALGFCLKPMHALGPLVGNYEPFHPRQQQKRGRDGH